MYINRSISKGGRMSETKFTKGPWAVVHLPDGTIRIDSDDVPEMAYIYEETGAD